MTAAVTILAACGRRAPQISARSLPPAVAAHLSARPHNEECPAAARERSRVPALLAQGKLDRAVRVIRRADTLCPETRSETAATLLDTLVELGRVEEAAELAKQLETDASASEPVKTAARRALASAKAASAHPRDEAGARALLAKAAAQVAAGQDAEAKATYLLARSESPPNANALFEAARCAKRMGDGPGAQRLYDRALVDLERAARAEPGGEGASVVLDVPNGLLGPPRSIASAPKAGVFVVAHAAFVSVFDKHTLQERRRLGGGADDLWAVAISPDGETVAGGSVRGAIQVWDRATGALRATFTTTRSTGMAYPVNALAISPDGRTLAAGVEDGTVRTWDLTTGRQNAPWETDMHVTAVAFAPGGRDIVFGNWLGQVHIFDPVSQSWGQFLEWAKGGISALSTAPEKSLIAAASLDGTVRIWNTTTNRLLRGLEPHAKLVQAVVFSPNGERIAAATSDGVRIWDPATGKLVQTLSPGSRRSGQQVLSLAWIFDASALVVGLADESLEVWDPRVGKRLRVVRAHTFAMRSVGVSRDGATLRTASADGTGRIWDAATGQVRRVINTGSTVPGAWSPDGATFATGCDRRQGELIRVGSLNELPRTTICLWDARSGAVRRHLPARVDAAGGIAWSGSGARMASWWVEGVSLEDPARGHVLATIREPRGYDYLDAVGAVTFSADDQWFAWRTRWGFGLGDAATGKRRPPPVTGSEGEVSGIAFAGDAKLIVSTTRGESTLSDVQSGRFVQRFEDHGDEASRRALAVSPRSDMLAAAESERDPIHLLELPAGKLVRTIHAGDEPVSALSFTPDGGTLVIAAGPDVSGGDLAIRGHGSLRFVSMRGGRSIAVARAVEDTDQSYVFTNGPHGRIEFFGDAGRAYPVCRAGSLTLPFEACAERFEVDGLLAKALAGETAYLDP